MWGLGGLGTVVSVVSSEGGGVGDGVVGVVWGGQRPGSKWVCVGWEGCGRAVGGRGK